MIFRATSGSNLSWCLRRALDQTRDFQTGFPGVLGLHRGCPAAAVGKGRGPSVGSPCRPFIRARPFLCPSPAQRMDAQSWAQAAFTHQLQPVAAGIPGGRLCHPQKAAGQGGHRRGRCATLGQHEPRGTLQAHCRNPGSGQGCAHFRAPAGGLGTLFSAEYALCPHRTVCGCLARAHPHTAAPLCRPWLPSAVPGLGGYGCRQLSF